MTGFLTDTQIKQMLDDGKLLRTGTWAENNIRHASYTLRLGPEVRVIDPTGASSAVNRDERVVRVSEDHPLELGPGQTALLYCEEELDLDDDILGFTVARGLLYVEALVPENTYVDPGFSGFLYTTVVNISNRKVSLTLGMGIARLFFFRLEQAVNQPYKSGRALKIEQQLQSVSAVPVTTVVEAASATDGQLRQTMGSMGPSGLMAAEFAKRTSRRVLTLAIFAFLWPLILLLASKLGMSNFWVGFTIAIMGNLIAAAIAFYIPRFLRRWK